MQRVVSCAVCARAFLPCKYRRARQHNSSTALRARFIYLFSPQHVHLRPAHAVRGRAVQALLCRPTAELPPMLPPLSAAIRQRAPSWARSTLTTRRSWRRSPPTATARLRPGGRITSANVGAFPWSRWLEVRARVRVGVRDRVRVRVRD